MSLASVLTYIKFCRLDNTFQLLETHRFLMLCSDCTHDTIAWRLKYWPGIFKSKQPWSSLTLSIYVHFSESKYFFFNKISLKRTVEYICNCFTITIRYSDNTLGGVLINMLVVCRMFYTNTPVMIDKVATRNITYTSARVVWSDTYLTNTRLHSTIANRICCLRDNHVHSYNNNIFAFHLLPAVGMTA